MKAILLLILFFVLMACATLPSNNESIGIATMLTDGSIILNLRAESESDLVGHAEITYKTNDPEYKNIIKHLGGLSKGESKLVPPWPNIE